MEKVILIDLEDTITVHKSPSRVKDITVAWLKYNGVVNAEDVYENEKYKNRDERIKLLGITFEEYKSWYSNFNIVEFEYYKQKFLDKQIIVPTETIRFIKECHFPLILVSNSSPLWVDYILNELSLKENFKYVFHRDYCFDDIKKPDKEVLNIIERHLQVKIDKSSVMIGDSKTDLEFAKNCGIKFISVYNKFEGEIYCKDFNELILELCD